jgi:hypothetical protein
MIITKEGSVLRLCLISQVYRHVDNVMFENAHLVERFLNYWRSTGHQRIGFLYGKYEIHADVPLGIRATVAAIYEPPQVSNHNPSLYYWTRTAQMFYNFKIVIPFCVKSQLTFMTYAIN